MQQHIRRPAVGDPDRAARLREIALKAAAKRRANIAAGIRPAAKRAAVIIREARDEAVKVARAVERFIVVPVLEEVERVAECGHAVADLLAIAAAARGEDAKPEPVVGPFYCKGCENVGRTHPAERHENGTGRCSVAPEWARRPCACTAYVPGRPINEPRRANDDRVPERITVNGRTYKRLGHGASRVTFDLGCGKCVLKTLHGKNVGFGRNAMPFQSKAEVDFYEQTPDADRKFLGAIFARSADYSIEIMEKLDLQRPDDGEHEMRAFAARKGIADLHGANVGWRNGRMVILDYGFAPRDR